MTDKDFIFLCTWCDGKEFSLRQWEQFQELVRKGTQPRIVKDCLNRERHGDYLDHVFQSPADLLEKENK